MDKSKETIRHRMLSIRSELKQEEYLEKSRLIQQKIHPILIAVKGPVHLFGAMTNRREVNTWPLIIELWKRNLPVWMPVVLPDQSLAHAPVFNESQLDDSHPWGLIQPFHNLIQSVPVFGLILIPGLAFDLQGNRIGYGKGYYDAFLKDQQKAEKIGLCFDFQFEEKLPTTDSDVPVDRVITDKRHILIRTVNQ